MISQANSMNQLALDIQGYGELQRAARQNSTEALKTVATQFEAMFINMMMKSMRDAMPQEGLFGSEQTRMYSAMLDQQLSQTMASRGIGLADVLIRQLSIGRADAAGQVAADLQRHAAQDPMPLSPSVMSQATQAVSGMQPHVRQFLQRLAPHAEQASRSTGIPPRFILGHAALESGWGRREIMASDGTPSHNLFGIKAGGGWKGRVVETLTTEYVNGQPQRRVEKFRAYDSYAAAFHDYGRLLQGNPRYRNVIANVRDAEGFALSLQRAGYATDPDYAAKLTRIIRHSLA